MPRALLHFFFDQLYTRLAWSYDAVAWLVSGGQWQAWTASALPCVQDGPVLEVGCGRGHLLPALAARGWTALGLDRSPQMARAAHRRHRAVCQGDGMALPLADGSVGTLITTFPAPYVLRPETQVEFARVVRPGGRWLWVDVPMLFDGRATALARAITAIAYGEERRRNEWIQTELWQDRTERLWTVHIERLPLRHSSIGLRIAERRPL